MCIAQSITTDKQVLPRLPVSVLEGKDYRVTNTFICVEEKAGSSSRRAASTPPSAGLLSEDTLRVVNKPRVAAGTRSGRPVRKISLESELSLSPTCSTRCSDSESASGNSDSDGATIRIGNLPNRAKLERIQSFLEDLSLMKYCDSIYMPLDRKTGVCKGYAFLHFTDEAMALQFCKQADGQTLPRSVSPKQMCTSFASRQQAATIPKKLPKNSTDGRTFTAFLWIR